MSDEDRRNKKKPRGGKPQGRKPQGKQASLKQFLGPLSMYVGGKTSVLLERAGFLDWLVEKGFNPARNSALQEILEMGVQFAKMPVDQMPRGVTKDALDTMLSEFHQILQRLRSKTNDRDKRMRDGKKLPRTQQAAQGKTAVSVVLGNILKIYDPLTKRYVHALITELKGETRLKVCEILSGYGPKELAGLEYIFDSGEELAHFLDVEIVETEEKAPDIEDELGDDEIIDLVSELYTVIDGLGAEDSAKVLAVFSELPNQKAWKNAVKIMYEWSPEQLRNFANLDREIQLRMLGVFPSAGSVAKEKAKGFFGGVSEMISDILTTVDQHVNITGIISRYRERQETVRIRNQQNLDELDAKADQLWDQLSGTGGE